MKKTFFNFLSTVIAVSMLASASTVVNAAEEDVNSPEYTIKKIDDKNVIITSITVQDENTTEITIPATYENAAVVGVADYACINIPNLEVINLPDTLKIKNTGNFAFITQNVLINHIETALDNEITEDAIVLYVAEKLNYNGKTENFTDEELAEIKTKLHNKASMAGVPEGTTDWKKAAVIMLSNKEKMGLSAEISNELTILEATVTYDKVAINAPEGSEIASYVKALPVKYSLGDANGDGKVNVRDAAAIASALAKNNLSMLTAASDYNKDGKINVRDAAAIANMLANSGTK